MVWEFESPRRHISVPDRSDLTRSKRDPYTFEIVGRRTESHLPRSPIETHRGRNAALRGRPTSRPTTAARFTAAKSVAVALSVPVIALFLLLGCGAGRPDRPPSADLPDIEERGTLRVITSYGPLSYFVYRGEPLGYEYELAERFAYQLGVDLDIVPAYDISEMFELLDRGEGDMIAYRLSVTASRRERAAFSDTVTATRQVLVQPKPENWRSMRTHEIEEHMIRDPSELAGREIYVRSGSAYINRLQNLSDEIGEEIIVREAPAERTTEELIKAVHERELPLTVADENIARITTSFYENIDVATAISLEQRLAWALPHDAGELLEEVNAWLDYEKRHADFYVIYNRYFNTPRSFRARLSDEAFRPFGGPISPWDDEFREAAGKIGWDWRLLAALAFQESRFNPRARSWAGAVGLMQIMPATAREYGARNLNDPVQSIQAGGAFLKWLDQTWARDIPDEQVRRAFVLGSYNVGRGHVQDARRLTEYYGGNPDDWDDVSEYLIRKMDPEYYNHELVQFGYARGTEPVTYVRNINRLYQHYLRVTEEEDP